MQRPGLQSSVTLESLLALSDAEAGAEVERSVLLFECGNELFAIDAADVDAVVEAGVTVPLPYPPAGVAGVASVRGSMRLVVCPGTGPPAGRGRLLALSCDRNLAIFADRVIGVVSAGAHGEAQSTPDGRSTRMRIGDRDAVLVDPAALIGP